MKKRKTPVYNAEYRRAQYLKHREKTLKKQKEYDDGKEWLHVSVSRKSRLPTYEELTRIKRDFIGDDKKAVFVLPEKEKHVNIHNFCLHLFYSAANPLPDFTGGSGSI